MATKTKKRPTKQPKPEEANGEPESLEQIHARWDRALATHLEERKAFDKLQDAKRETRETRAAWEAARERHVEAMSEAREQPGLPFGAPGTADNGDWQSVPLRSALAGQPGMTEKLFDRLEQAELVTMGNLTDYTKAHGDQWKIKGIGGETIAKIGDASAAFFARRNTEAEIRNGQATDAEDAKKGGGE